MLNTSEDRELADRSAVVPNKNVITVGGILEKSWLAGAVKAELVKAGLQASCKSITWRTVPEQSK
jgi:hypothetical protein